MLTLEDAGNFLALVSDQPALLAGALFTWFFVASFIPWALIDTLGRRKLLLICISGMAACFAIETGLVWSVEQTNSKAAGGAATAFLFLYMALFTVGRRLTLSPCVADHGRPASKLLFGCTRLKSCPCSSVRKVHPSLPLATGSPSRFWINRSSWLAD